MDVKENKYFYCYSPKLKLHLSGMGIKYITKGVHFKTNKCFWMYERTEQLKLALDNWL